MGRGPGGTGRRESLRSFLLPPGWPELRFLLGQQEAGTMG